MGDLFSKPSQADSTATDDAAVTMSSPNPELSGGATTPEPKSPIEISADLPPEPTAAEIKEQASENEAIPGEKPEEETIDGDNSEQGGEGEGETEEGECGFCLFMKGGGCKEAFTDWEKCVEEGEKNKEDIVEKCFQVTAALKSCMEAHSDYYAPLLQAEKAAEEEAARQLEQERENLKDVSGEKEEAEENSGGGDENKSA
ncbi:GCK domain-containing protein [Striga hermonthica]|uniref:GCK domain-containing protein n=1 Tax=Striga hermonthica TaxID=68872 RepID=A0A9N7RED2_STRHE|nr:GCK domain-containing protein [Striga hermonthica]